MRVSAAEQQNIAVHVIYGGLQEIQKNTENLKLYIEFELFL